MTEPQEIADEAAVTAAEAHTGEAPRVSQSTLEVDGKVWTVVELEDHESWDLYAGTPANRGARLGHVTITDGGYFSTDAAGALRGPYVTLSEATYPLGLDDTLLLGDVVKPKPAQTRTPSPPALLAPKAIRRPWLREVLLVVAAVGFGLGAQRLFSPSRRIVRLTSLGSRAGRG